MRRPRACGEPRVDIPTNPPPPGVVTNFFFHFEGSCICLNLRNGSTRYANEPRMRLVETSEPSWPSRCYILVRSVAHYHVTRTPPEHSKDSQVLLMKRHSSQVEQGTSWSGDCYGRSQHTRLTKATIMRRWAPYAHLMHQTPIARTPTGG